MSENQDGVNKEELMEYLKKIPKSKVIDLIVRDALVSGRDLTSIINIHSQV